MRKNNRNTNRYTKNNTNNTKRQTRPPIRQNNPRTDRNYYMNSNRNNNILRGRGRINSSRRPTPMPNYQALTRRFDNMLNTTMRAIRQLNIGTRVAKNAITQNPNVEIRYDKLYTAYDMYRMNKFYPLYKSPLATIFYPVYNEYTVLVAAANNWTVCNLIWTPYGYPYIDKTTRVTINNSKVVPTQFCNLLRVAPRASAQTSDVYWYPSTLSEIPGMQRLVAATMKISNVTSLLDKAGTYTAYKIHPQYAVPIITASGWQQEANPWYIVSLMEQANQDYSLVPTKLLTTATQRLTINEFNTLAGNNQFQGPCEYQGLRYKNETNDFTLHLPLNEKYMENFVGTNVAYKIAIATTAAAQTFKIQTWQVFEIAPENNSFSPLALIHRNTASEQVLSQMQGNFPFTQSEL